ncbi:hypothetical protein EJW76_25735, partial [Escherichia coli]|nr:hypothetical protein [Escherichia coli]
DNNCFYILLLTSVRRNHADAYCYKTFRCSKISLEAFSRVPKSFFFIRSRFSNWKKFCKRIVVITATEHTLLQVL